MFYNINAEPICTDCWAKLFEIYEYKRIALTVVGEGDLAVEVSTVWLGNDMNFLGQGPPLIFETMVFDHHTAVGEYCERYDTQEAALLGHEQAVEWAKANMFLFPKGQQ